MAMVVLATCLVASIIIVFSCSISSVMYKEKERKLSKEGQRGKNCSEGIQRKGKRGSMTHVRFQISLEAN
jgi:hypothetical protein